MDPRLLDDLIDWLRIPSVSTGGGDPAPALIKAAKAAQADILVAGAFGHPRLQEFIFGGATRTFLSAEGPSLFLSH